jgi:hypothetical protein
MFTRIEQTTSLTNQAAVTTRPRRHTAFPVPTGAGPLHGATPAVRITPVPPSFSPMPSPEPRRCACGGIVGVTGECESCRQKRLAREGMMQHAAGMAGTGSPRAYMEPRLRQGISGAGARPGFQATDISHTSSSTTLSGRPAHTNVPLHAPVPIPSNTVHCVKKWNPCSAPYSPGTWAAKVTYHCPRYIFPGIILPGTTQTSYVTIPDEFIGVDPVGRDMYRCRPGFQVRIWTDVADTIATTVNRTILYPGQQPCHDGFRRILRLALESVFRPSGGGRSAGIRVNAPPPPSGFPCP